MSSTTSDFSISLPERENMLARLKNVNEEDHVVEHFYPLLLRMAGKTMEAEEFITNFLRAVKEYAKPVPFMGLVLSTQMPNFINAIFAKEEAEEIKKIAAQMENG